MKCNIDNRYAGDKATRICNNYIAAIMLSGTMAAADIMGYKERAMRNFTNEYVDLMADADVFCEGFGTATYLNQVLAQRGIDLQLRPVKYTWFKRQKRVVRMLEAIIALALLHRRASRATVHKVIDKLESKIGNIDDIDMFIVERLKKQMKDVYGVTPIFK